MLKTKTSMKRTTEIHNIMIMGRNIDDDCDVLFNLIK